MKLITYNKDGTADVFETKFGAALAGRGCHEISFDYSDLDTISRSRPDVLLEWIGYLGTKLMPRQA